MTNELHFGDNLDVLRAMPAASIDLIYLDPPFNSNAAYDVLFGTARGGPSQAQSHAFADTWKWNLAAQRAINQTAERHLTAGALLDALQMDIMSLQTCLQFTVVKSSAKRLKPTRTNALIKPRRLDSLWLHKCKPDRLRIHSERVSQAFSCIVIHKKSVSWPKGK